MIENIMLSILNRVFKINKKIEINRRFRNLSNLSIQELEETMRMMELEMNTNLMINNNLNSMNDMLDLNNFSTNSLNFVESNHIHNNHSDCHVHNHNHF